MVKKLDPTCKKRPHSAMYFFPFFCYLLEYKKKLFWVLCLANILIEFLIRLNSSDSIHFEIRKAWYVFITIIRNTLYIFELCYPLSIHTQTLIHHENILLFITFSSTSDLYIYMYVKKKRITIIIVLLIMGIHIEWWYVLCIVSIDDFIHFSDIIYNIYL